jgi:hypothetical protein
MGFQPQRACRGARFVSDVAHHAAPSPQRWCPRLRAAY